MFDIKREPILAYEAVALLNRIADETVNGKEGKKPNQDMAEIAVKYGLSRTEQAAFFQPILEIYDFASLGMSGNINDIVFYFHEGQGTMSFGSMVYLLQYLNDISQGLTENEIRNIEMLLFLHLIGRDDVSAKPSLSTNEMIAILKNSDATDGQKWYMLDLFFNFTHHKTQVENLLSAARKLLEQKIDIAGELLDSCVSRLESGKSAFEGYKDSFTAQRKHVVAPSIIAFKEVVAYEILEGVSRIFADKIPPTPPVIHYGVLCDKLHDKKENIGADSIENLFSQLKSITDMTRLRILKLISNGPMKGYEIAKAVGLTPATVSHHMNELFSQNFVSIEKQGASVLYSLNYAAFERLSMIIGKIFITDQFEALTHR